MGSPAINLLDAYKIGHVEQYPEGTEYVYSNFTARSSRDPDINYTVVFGIKYFVDKYLKQEFDRTFFSLPLERACGDYKKRVEGVLQTEVDVSHIRALHRLQYLPLLIKALPEGTRCPIGVPCLTITNTLPEFFWLVNYIETLMSSVLWGMMTSATTADKFKQLLSFYARKTGGSLDDVNFQAHDFSMRGMFGPEAAAISGAGHLLSFTGTDCVPAIDLLEQYYGGDPATIGGSIPATEHSVMCAAGPENEEETYRRLINDVYPGGMVSVVSDSWDYWNTIRNIVPKFKANLEEKGGKLVIRPDSGDPVDVVLGTMPILWEHFGGSVNTSGYKVLNPCIGLIYGDSINYDRAEKILSGLEKRGFCSTNVVLGLGSFTYQFTTRDQYSFAMKATSVVIDGERKAVFKDPVDDSVKTSARGLLKVNDQLRLFQDVTEEEEQTGALEVVFVDGYGQRRTLQDIRNRLNSPF